MLVLTFVLSIGLLVKATQLVVKGFPAELVLKYIAVSLPESLSFTIPLASLVSALLLFGRLSADGEVSAMRSCGINIWSIMTPVILFGLSLTVLSVYINSDIAPTGSARRHALINNTARTKDLVKLLEPGRFISDIPGVDLWFESRDGDILKNLLIHERLPSGGTRETRCEEAVLGVETNAVVLMMKNVRITPFSERTPGTATAQSLVHRIENSVKRRNPRKKAGDLTNAEIRERIFRLDRAISSGNPADGLSDAERLKLSGDLAASGKKGVDEVTREELVSAAEKMAPQVRSSLLTELNRRFALGLAPIAFILLGMPLGIRTSRRESNIGIAISLAVMLLYYAFMIAAKSLSKYPGLYPHAIIWMPTVICVATASVLIKRNQ